jgi:hypothetical protein
MGNVTSQWQGGQGNFQDQFNNNVVPRMVDQWHSDSPNAWWNQYQPGGSKGGGPQPAPTEYPYQMQQGILSGARPQPVDQSFNSVIGPPSIQQMGTPDNQSFQSAPGPPSIQQVGTTPILPTSSVIQPPQPAPVAPMALPQAATPLPVQAPLRGFNPYVRTMAKGGYNG